MKKIIRTVPAWFFLTMGFLCLFTPMPPDPARNLTFLGEFVPELAFLMFSAMGGLCAFLAGLKTQEENHAPSPRRS